MKEKSSYPIKYNFSIENAHQQYVQIRVDFPENTALSEIKLPVWRPGRYEIANFAKNIKSFRIFDSNGKKVAFHKKNKSTWVLNSKPLSGLRIEYLYFSNELNAGSTFLDENQLYVNPVNCCIYVDELIDYKCQLTIDVPASWQIATGLNQKDGVFISSNYDQLADSPFVCSKSLQCKTYKMGGCKFYIWVNGDFKPLWDKWLNDFKLFTQKQIEKFIEFPVKEYHFLIHALPFKAYHGVEHLSSTVITLGPSEQINNKLYKELLGISSHELYHVWNVKSIRPVEMLPYDFSKENYSELGYIYEGITTYMGDLFLLKSDVFTVEQYFFELNNQLQRHFDNPGRFNYSVAESSFDTWLDGYVLGAPGRKVSIYVEGCLLAFVTDVRILQSTSGKYGLDEVMKRLFFNYAMKGVGVTEEIFKKEIENISGSCFNAFFQNFIHGNHSYESILNDSLNVLGLQLNVSKSSNFIESYIGCKVVNSIKTEKRKVITTVYPGSPAELACLKIGDELNLESVNHLKEEIGNEIIVHRKNKEFNVELPQVNKNFYNKYSVSFIDNPIKEQNRLFEAWKN